MVKLARPQLNLPTDWFLLAFRLPRAEGHGLTQIAPARADSTLLRIELTSVPMVVSTRIDTTEMRPRISAYSTSACPSSRRRRTRTVAYNSVPPWDVARDLARTYFALHAMGTASGRRWTVAKDWGLASPSFDRARRHRRRDKAGESLCHSGERGSDPSRRSS